MYDHRTGRELVMTEVLDGLVRTRKAGTFSEEVLGQAEGIFRRLRERGVIRGGSFEDSVWALTNETDVFRLRFPDDEKAYLAGAGTWPSSSCRQDPYPCRGSGTSSMSCPF